ncbi:hypothetical protein PPERSA_07309 [Pseudocohnilembus persalinus]|uniref:Uncharacterized protein n=1 Tax=Pseudocohnilembus persalinus TaxID=266149 RepID=A0A0V0R782_PSEPJ|nr:hypothetical protein PPERSA_07309 [Pseudocohnilembus persalinus]|eukprot:KRX10224.1 hypothetical protein PPERSA_07309 [Pseudocohnilembus persalinus]
MLNQQKCPLILLQKSFKYQDNESKFKKSVEQNNNIDKYSQIKKQFHHQKENTNKIIEECLEYKTGICRENFYQEVYNNDKNEENQRKILEIYNEQEKEFQQFAETLDENTTLDDVDNFFNSNLMGDTDTKSFWQCFLQSVHKCFELQ